MPAKNPITSNVVLDNLTLNMLTKLKVLPEFRGSKSAVVREALTKLAAEKLTSVKREEVDWGTPDARLTIQVPITLHVQPGTDVPKLLQALFTYFTEYLVSEKSEAKSRQA